MTFMPLVTTFVVTLIGIAAIAQLEGLVGAQSDAVVPELPGTLGSGGARVHGACCTGLCGRTRCHYVDGGLVLAFFGFDRGARSFGRCGRLREGRLGLENGWRVYSSPR